MGSSSRSLPRPFVLMLILTMLLAAIAIVTEPASSAQVERDGPSAKYTVTVNLCLAPGCTELAEAIAPADGVAVTASNADDGEVFGSCVTGADGPGTCTLDVRLVPMLAFAFDESTIPDGYVLDANPQIVPNQSDEPAAVSTLGVLLYPEGGFPPSETRQVPVRAMICGDASCADYQEGIFGVEITATDVDTGVVLDSCVTDAGNQIGGCVLSVPSASIFSLGWDESAIPDGLVSYGDPIPGPIASGGTDGYTLAFFAPERDAPAPTAVPPQEPPPPVIAPDGMPAGLYAGSCAEGGLGERIVQLNGPAVPEGAVQGATDAIPVGVGFTVIDVPFRDMLNGGRVIAVFDDDGETMIVCGPVGGVLDVNGAMSMGLAPAGDSGAVGMAYLNAQNDATATGISIFLIPEVPGAGETPVP